MTTLLILALGCTKDEPVDDTAAEAAWTLALEDDDRGALMALWGPASDDIWVVGGQPEAGVVLRGSGTSWSAVDLPEGTPLLTWVHGTSSDDVWVTGVSGTLLHWDGGAWTDHSVALAEAFWGVFAASETDVVAVGGESAYGERGDHAVVYSYTEEGFLPQDLPVEMDEVANLFKVTHDGTDWWIVGYRGAALRGSDPGALQAVATGVGGDIVTVASSEHGVIAVGGRGTGMVFLPDGDTLSQVAEARSGLSGVSWAPDGRALVAGDYGYTALFDPADASLTDLPLNTQDVLHGAFVAPDGTLYAAGGNLYTSEDSFHGVLMTLEAR